MINSRRVINSISPRCRAFFEASERENALKYKYKFLFDVAIFIRIILAQFDPERDTLYGLLWGKKKRKMEKLSMETYKEL